MTKCPQSGPVYLQQPSMEIIQLTEVSPPPRGEAPFALTASSFASSSYSSSTDSEEDESVCSSYCSSDPEEEARTSAPDDTYKTRLHRVLLWREKLAKAMGTTALASLATPPSSTLLKRKADVDVHDSDDDMASHSSKRSRSDAYRSQAPWTQRRLCAHSCPACDASFATRHSLQEHAQDPSSNDACRTAVEYGFEP
ncbi:hypothetical protein POSPLADRAFT_1039289 [Postia placenta MAD-698-R-SB12]|uniref:Uncharacterized protein n=1 Tax=Postia placenta MAD-698-R-SB12 TaxID=670580 RepID=A0A1X6N6S0_9APHY|nr:hypothetical protein POSPLADRAFT_1039289 [Postia placenta MAD-698-R-SB12]OSX64093.1 hypothetical protein POSPLADRAFT_1039289 [Postia placenta MAD-698-R-SB12]